MESFLKQISLFFKGYYIDSNGKITIRFHCFSGLEEGISQEKLKNMEDELNKFSTENVNEIKKDPNGYAKYIKKNVSTLLQNPNVF